MNHKNFFEQIKGGGYRSILALHGSLPDSSFFKELSLPIIAVDGAANALMNMDLIVGDLDSVREDLRLTYPSVHLPDQSKSDFEKALELLEARDLLPAIIVGINGGYIDHVVNNINIFMRTKCLFYDPPIVGQVLSAQQEHHFFYRLLLRYRFLACLWHV